MDISPFKEAHKGPVIIIGSGPTSVDYVKFLKARPDAAVILLNAAGQLASDVLASRKVNNCGPLGPWFVTHHPETYLLANQNEWLGHCKVLFPGATYINTALATYTRVFHEVPAQYYRYDMDAVSIEPVKLLPKTLAKLGYLLTSRAHVQQHKRLFGAWGSITTALHWAWYLDATELLLVGCTPDVAGYDARLAPADTQPEDLTVPWHNQETLIQFFGIKHQYIK